MINISKYDLLKIQTFIKKCNFIYQHLENVIYKKALINYNDINTFNVSSKCNNDNNNKIREIIICSIVNNKVPDDYYKYSFRWRKLKNETYKYIDKLCTDNNIIIKTQKCIIKAGRSNHYDFKIIINDINEFNVELKFNAECIKETPQFISPMKPSKYLEYSYEEYYYDNYLKKLSSEYGLILPCRKEYINKIHSNSPSCVNEYQEKYYKGCVKSSKYTAINEDIDFYEKSKKISKESIISFINLYSMNIKMLTEYLLETQKNKYYMFYKNNNIYLETVNQDNYIITSYIKDPDKQRYMATTKSGNILKILLRWKNGNGIAFPSFQIS